MALLESVGSIGTATATTIATGTLSSAPPSGSVVLIAISQGGNGNGSATISGFSTVPGLSVLSLPTSASSYCTILYKIAGGSEPTSYTATLNSSNFAATTCWVFTGRNTSSLFTAVSSAVASATAATPLSIAIPGVTAAAGDDVLWVSALSNSQGNGNPGPSFTPPTGLSNAITETSTTSFTVGMVGACETNVPAGITGPLTGSVAYTGGGSNSWGGYVISLAIASYNAPTLIGFVQATAPQSIGVSVPANTGFIIVLANWFPVQTTFSVSDNVNAGNYQQVATWTFNTATWGLFYMQATATGTPTISLSANG